jgi:hypothetical protein
MKIGIDIMKNYSKKKILNIIFFSHSLPWGPSENENLYDLRDDEFDPFDEEADWNDFGNENGDASKTSFACEDCDYRWEDFYEEEDEISDEHYQTCPMCGSTAVSQL